jgi:hypothetical protein
MAIAIFHTLLQATKGGLGEGCECGSLGEEQRVGVARPINRTTSSAFVGGSPVVLRRLGPELGTAPVRPGAMHAEWWERFCQASRAP